MPEKTDTFTTHSENALRVITQNIITGKYPSGMRLVLRKIAAELDISRVPVSEALNRLEADGLVESIPHRGYRVREFTEENKRNELAVREAIECQSARLCAQYTDEDTMEMLKLLARKVDKALHDKTFSVLENAAFHLHFHKQIAISAGYPLLAKLLTRGWLFSLFANSSTQSISTPPPSDWHTQLINVIASRNVNEAEQKMRQHINYIRE